MPERSTAPGYRDRSTIAPAPVASFSGNVASRSRSPKVTVRPRDETVSRPAKSDAGPMSVAMPSIRSKECRTSRAVRGRPLANSSPSRRVHAYAVRDGSGKRQLSAASGTGVADPGRRVRSDW